MDQDSGVLDEERRAAATDAEQTTYSLVEVAQKTGIPMPILLRYKREHPDRVPSVGSGSQQRFPETAIEALRAIHREDSAREDEPRRGGFGLLSLPRLRKQVRRPEADDDEPAPAEEAAAEPSRAPAEAAGAPIAGGMTLVEVSEKLGIPYPTVARYASQYGDQIPHQGRGRARRFPPEALAVFERIRRESKPGRPPKKDKAKRAARTTAATSQAASGAETPALEQLARRIESLERSQKLLEDQIRDLLEELSHPATATVEV